MSHPVSLSDIKNTLASQVYWKGQVEQFPEGGKMSQHLESMAIGDHIEVKGPLGHFHYLGRGRCA